MRVPPTLAWLLLCSLAGTTQTFCACATWASRATEARATSASLIFKCSDLVRAGVACARRWITDFYDDRVMCGKERLPVLLFASHPLTARRDLQPQPGRWAFWRVSVMRSVSIVITWWNGHRCRRVGGESAGQMRLVRARCCCCQQASLLALPSVWACRTHDLQLYNGDHHIVQAVLTGQDDMALQHRKQYCRAFGSQPPPCQRFALPGGREAVTRKGPKSWKGLRSWPVPAVHVQASVHGSSEAAPSLL